MFWLIDMSCKFCRRHVPVVVDLCQVYMTKLDGDPDCAMSHEKDGQKGMEKMLQWMLKCCVLPKRIEFPQPLCWAFTLRVKFAVAKWPELGRWIVDLHTWPLNGPALSLTLSTRKKVWFVIDYIKESKYSRFITLWLHCDYCTVHLFVFRFCVSVRRSAKQGDDEIVVPSARASAEWISRPGMRMFRHVQFRHVQTFVPSKFTCIHFAEGTLQSIYLFLCESLCISTCRSLSFNFLLIYHPSVYLSICPFVYLPTCLFTRLFAYANITIYSSIDSFLILLFW